MAAGRRAVGEEAAGGEGGLGGVGGWGREDVVGGGGVGERCWEGREAGGEEEGLYVLNRDGGGDLLFYHHRP